MKKVLIISYYWPPSGGVSVLRTLKIVKYLRRFGWEPIVYHPSNAHYPYEDESNFHDIPEKLLTLSHPIIEPFSLFKKFTGRSVDEPLNNILTVQTKRQSWKDKLGIWIRGNFFIPDARSFWILPSVKFLSKYIKEQRIDAIFSDGPPHTNTRIAYYLSKKFNIPWLSDFQDPWTQVDYYSEMKISWLADIVHKKMEKACFLQAKKITIASPTWKKDLEQIGAKNVDVIYYGYDESDFLDIIPFSKDSNTFYMVHTGLLGKDRNPVECIRTFAQMDLKIRKKFLLIGQVDYSVLEEIKKVSRGEVEIEYVGTVSRKIALSYCAGADLLLLPLNKAKNAQGRLPGKLYEYLRSNKPILALGPENSDAAEILKYTHSGYCVDYSDTHKIYQVLNECMHNSFRLTPDPERIAEFSNEKQTQKIAHILDAISK